MNEKLVYTVNEVADELNVKSSDVRVLIKLLGCGMRFGLRGPFIITQKDKQKIKELYEKGKLKTL